MTHPVPVRIQSEFDAVGLSIDRLNGVQWPRMLVIHADHHFAIIDDILAPWSRADTE